jgi:tRNA U34 5-carboxymethylaminomethyl modifying enzyme MnmG/GidA
MEGKIFIGEYNAPEGRLGEEAQNSVHNYLQVWV